jgi:hypothetical protein
MAPLPDDAGHPQYLAAMRNVQVNALDDDVPVPTRHSWGEPHEIQGEFDVWQFAAT